MPSPNDDHGGAIYTSGPSPWGSMSTGYSSPSVHSFPISQQVTGHGRRYSAVSVTSMASMRSDYGIPGSPSKRTDMAGRTSLQDNERTQMQPHLSLQSSQSHVASRKPTPLSALPMRCATATLNSNIVAGLMTFLTVFVLVGDDIRLVAFDQEADSIFNWVTLVALALFTIEITLSCFVKEDYFLGFWFYLDLIATVSLVFDLTYVSERMMGYPKISVENVDAQQQDQAVGQSEYARASRSSRVGTRVARLLRVVRIIRVSRIVACFQCLFRNKGNAQPAQPGEDVEDETGGESESRVGRKLSEKTTQRVIVLVLVMLVMIPQLNPGSQYVMMPASAQYGADVVYKAWEDYEREYLAQARANESFAWRANESVAWQGGQWTNASILAQYRLEFELELLMYLYYHNPHATCPDGATFEQDCAESFVYKLCFIGYVANTKFRGANKLDNTLDGYVQMLRHSVVDWSSLVHTVNNDDDKGDWRSSRYIVGEVPDDIKYLLSRPWTTDCSEDEAIYGVSLIRDTPCPRKTMRLRETTWYMPSLTKKQFFQTSMQGQFVFVFDIRKKVEWEAIMSILQTLFIVIVLAIGALFFSKDTDNLVLLPIERMISKVEIIRRDPLYAIKLGDQQYKERQENRGKTINKRASSQKVASTRVVRLKNRAQRLKIGKEQVQPAPKKATLETKILENAIIKLGSLLALGFGEAGSEIIGQNMDDDNATVNAMIPGSKVEAIYGFCDIRNFTTTTEVLQEKTMVFVNQVAEIVHRIVDEHLGAANKNVGEAFLLVWRIGRYALELRSKIADLAVMSFIQVVAELSRNGQLAEYREHPALLARLPNFRVSLGFGLHLGWSIEGAIGSEFKIDASYLSPHVNIASMLEECTATYGVAVLMSEPLVRFCNPTFRRNFRVIDHVMFQGSKTPTRIFTVDLNFEVLPVDNDRGARKKQNFNRYQERQNREKMKLQKLEKSFQVHQVFDTDNSVRRMRERFFLAFFQEFEKGYLNYEAGEWDVAEQVLRKTKTMLRCAGGEYGRVCEDGPSRTLLEFMATHKFKAPPGWPGYRELSER